MYLCPWVAYQYFCIKNNFHGQLHRHSSTRWKKRNINISFHLKGHWPCLVLGRANSSSRVNADLFLNIICNIISFSMFYFSSANGKMPQLKHILLNLGLSCYPLFIHLLLKTFKN